MYRAQTRDRKMGNAEKANLGGPAAIIRLKAGAELKAIPVELLVGIHAAQWCSAPNQSLLDPLGTGPCG